MYRLKIKDLISWKNKKSRKPLIIRGARQVGKTWLMKNFAKTEYKDYVYINFENDIKLKTLFELDYDVERIIKGIELFTDKKIDEENTLLIFDEIQAASKALTALKYFAENSNYHIICAGSLLGIAMHKAISFPVGKVEFIDLHPLSFSEFLLAIGKEKYLQLIMDKDFSMLSIFKDDLEMLLKCYYYIGGMPEVVADYIKNEDFASAREIQKQILIGYEQDFSKHAPNNIVPKIRALWNSIPTQLAKENKKFIYGLIKTGARAKEYEIALMWLIDCGLVHKVHSAKEPRIPLSMYEDTKAFKLFIHDVGLMSCMANLSPKIILNKNEIFKEFKGALTEQYVLMQLIANTDIPIYYWTNNKGSAEIDFLIQADDKIIPIEVKAEKNLKAKSLKVFQQKYQPEISIRTAMLDYKNEEWLLNIPLWSIGNLLDIL